MGPEQPKISPLELKKQEATEAFEQLGDFAAREVGSYIAGVHPVLENDDEFLKVFGEKLKKRFGAIRGLRQEVEKLYRAEG